MECILSYKAGTARVCITPNEPLWLAGYASRTAPARGKISDLYAAAIAIEDQAGEQFVIASADAIAVTREIADRIAEQVAHRHGLSRRQLLVTATHTHYAPEFRPDKQVFFNIPAEFGAKLPAVADKLIAAIVSVIDQALARLAPVRLFARKTTTSFAHNRRRHGVVAGTPSTEDLVDHDVPVLDCVDANGQRKAIVFGYACHNTTIPADDLRYCGDWAGFACQELLRSNPGATALFVPGAGADQNPEPAGSVELSQQYGLQMAAAVQHAVDGSGLEITGPICVAYEDIRLALVEVTDESLRKMLDSDDPPQQVKAGYLLDALKRGEKLITSYSAPVQIVGFGNQLLLVALIGEPVVDWAYKWKQGAWSAEHGVNPVSTHAPLIWIAGYCNDMFGYLPTTRVQSEGGYEGGRANLWSWIPAPFTDDVEERITDAVRRLVRQLSVAVE
jgi:hypothetical protein